MMVNRTTKQRLKILAVLTLAFLAVTCGGRTPAAITPPITATRVESVPTPTQTVTVTPMPTATATWTPEAPVAPTPALEGMEVYTWSSASPDGKWTVEGETAFPKTGDDYYTQLKVSRADGSVEWMAVDEWLHFGLGYTTPRPFHWSQEGRYLYFTNEPVPDGCVVFVNGSDLWKIDLTDGSVTQVVPHVGLWLSLSPDEATLAYIGYGDRGLVLRDLTASAEREISLHPGQEYQAGQITWSPDGTALVLTLAIRPCSKDWAESTSIVRVEAETLEQTALIDQDSRLFTILEWPTAERVLLVDNDGQHWWMDAVMGHLWQAGDLDASERPVVAALPGLVYRTDDGLWRVGPDGVPVQLADRPDAILSPQALQGVGSRQALYLEGSPGVDDADIWLADLATGQVRNLTGSMNRLECCPVWWLARPETILFGSWAQNGWKPSLGALTIVQSDGSGYRVLDEATSSGLPAPSPDGQTIAYGGGEAAWLYRWDTGPEVYDPAAYGLRVHRIGSAAWSPDGTQLAWVVGVNLPEGWRLGVGVFDLETQTARLLHPYEPIGLGGWPAAPVWSPDGRWLAYRVWPAMDRTADGLWVLRADGSEEHWLGVGGGPVWSPDGRWLAYNGEVRAWLAEVGTWRLRLLDLPMGVQAVDWVPVVAAPRDRKSMTLLAPIN